MNIVHRRVRQGRRRGAMTPISTRVHVGRVDKGKLLAALYNAARQEKGLKWEELSLEEATSAIERNEKLNKGKIIFCALNCVELHVDLTGELIDFATFCGHYPQIDVHTLIEKLLTEDPEESDRDNSYQTQLFDIN